MASTYSPLLRIELIGTGEQAGTWGDTTNTNLGTLLEQAIAGTATFSVTAANVTLTDLDGVADQARCAILNVTGTPGVTRNIVAPATSKIYLVKNGSNASVIIKTASSTGWEIEAGDNIFVAFDGSDFVPVSAPIDAAGNISVPTSIYFTGAGATISGDFTDDTQANRCIVKTTPNNSKTVLSLEPNGSVSAGAIATTLRIEDSGSFEDNGSYGAFRNIEQSCIMLEATSDNVVPAYLPLLFQVSGSERARIATSGEFHIAGTTDQGAYNLQVAGTGVWAAGAYVNGSDARIKDNVHSLDSCLDVVKAMRPVTYTYKQSYSKDQNVQPGFIAQELQAAMAGKNYLNGVVQEGKKQLNVAYQNIIPILTKAIQEQQEQIEQLKAEVAALKGA